MNRIGTYLRRIGYHGNARVSFATLHDLQRLHLQSVPYENLDIMRGVPISLKIEDLYEKIVLRRRGGYCFELNALFAWLLKNLGFAVTDYMSRFLRDEAEMPMRRHRVLCVACEGAEYICDVGVGGVIPRKPLPLDIGKLSEQNGEKYILKEDDFLGNVLWEWRHDSWRKIYAFTREPQLEQDFTAISYYCEAHQDSFFKTQDMVHIFTETGRKSVAGREVKYFTPEGVNVFKPTTTAAYHELLMVHFGIKL
ncbi:MAG: arylamine N-acetyltransferase [Defluviitaleaceae bacterium]|nr:arylamine N-acetyltransferase [Defluviitaleaceae bacterium]